MTIFQPFDLIAHTDEARDPELLSDHAVAVAKKAMALAGKFDAADCGFAAGLLHDLGKAKPAFQAYIRGLGPSEPPAAAGARFAVKH